VAPQVRTGAPDLPDWLAAREPSLQRAAHLLTGDVDRAQPLVLETLARLHLAWRRVRRSDDIDTEALRLLVRAFRTASPRDGDPETRTVLVLRLHEHLTDAEIADLMHTSVSSVRTVTVSDEAATARSFAEATDDVEYPVTALSAVTGRAGEIRRARRRTAGRVGAAVVATAVVGSTAVLLGRGHDSDPTPPPVAPLPRLALGAAPGVDYLEGDRFVPASGEPITSAALRRASTATAYSDGVLAAGRVTSRRPFATISYVSNGLISRIGCGTPSFVLGGDAPAYWLSDSCRAVDTRRLVYGDTGRMVLSPTRAATTGVVAYTPVGRVSDGLVAYGVSESSTVGNATYVLQAQDGASRLVSHVEVPRGATPNGDLVSGLTSSLTDSLVVDADSGRVRWRLPGWSLGRFSPSGRYVVGFRSAAGLPHLGAASDSLGIWEASTGHEVLVRDLPGLMLDSLPVWESDGSVLVVAEDRGGAQAIVRIGTDGSVTRATHVGRAVLSGFRLAATP